MSSTARSVLIEYRIPKKSFAQAVRHYAGLFLEKVPDPIPEDQLLIQVFKVPNDDEYFQCELCLTCVPEDASASDNVPLVFWGSDEQPAEATSAAADAPDEQHPGEQKRQLDGLLQRRSFAERPATVADAFGNRTGFIINPDFP